MASSGGCRIEKDVKSICDSIVVLIGYDFDKFAPKLKSALLAGGENFAFISSHFCDPPKNIDT